MIDFRELCRLLSDYCDQELESELCSEIEELIKRDFFSETLFSTFRKTLDLCREMEEEMVEVPREVHLKFSQFLRIEIIERREI